MHRRKANAFRREPRRRRVAKRCPSRGAKGSCIESASNRSAGADSLRRKRMARFLNRKSQRYYRLKFADTYYGEMTHYGLYRLAWADVRRTRT